MKKLLFAILIAACLLTFQSGASIAKGNCTPTLISDINPSIIGQIVTFNGDCYNDNVNYNWNIDVNYPPVIQHTIIVDNNGHLSFEVVFNSTGKHTIYLFVLHGKMAYTQISADIQIVN